MSERTSTNSKYFCKAFIVYSKDLAEPDTCEWTYQSCDDCYDTECGKTIQFMTGELSEDDDFKFCPYCGKPIKVKEEDE